MHRRRLTAWLTIGMLTALLVSAVTAGNVTILYDAGPNVGQSTGVVLSTPDTYGSCTAVSDLITTTGVGERQLLGQVLVEYVVSGDRIVVPGGHHPINQTGDLNLTVSYPPVSEWPSNEIHVDIQLELYEGGLKVASIGGYQGGVPPANNWDIYCEHATRTPTDMPTDTPTNTPTNTPTDTPTNTPTNTPTSTPTNTPTNTPTSTPTFEGCTPGYWKQTQHFDSWPAPYTPTMTFYQAFGVGPQTLKLIDALNLGTASKQALMRHGVAALLNAASSGVDYPYTTAQVINLVKKAFATGNFEAIKNKLEAANELGCRLT